MSHERAQALLRTAGEVLTRCQQDFDTGQPVNVLPMQEVVADFCETLKSMPKDEAKLYEEPLNVMMEGLQALEVLLRSRRDELRTQVQSLNANQQAQAAYKKFTPEGSE